MKSKTILFSLTIASILIAGNLYSQPAGSGMGMGRGHGPMHRGGEPMCYGDWEQMKERLNLSDSQIDKVSMINKEFRETMRRHREKMEPLQLKLNELLLGDVINESEVKALLRRISDIEIDIRMARIRQRIAIEDVLTKDQRGRLRSERKGMMRK